LTKSLRVALVTEAPVVPVGRLEKLKARKLRDEEEISKK